MESRQERFERRRKMFESMMKEEPRSKSISEKQQKEIIEGLAADFDLDAEEGKRRLQEQVSSKLKEI
jgi:hypothetical protein